MKPAMLISRHRLHARVTTRVTSIGSTSKRKHDKSKHAPPSATITIITNPPPLPPQFGEHRAYRRAQRHTLLGNSSQNTEGREGAARRLHLAPPAPPTRTHESSTDHAPEAVPSATVTGAARAEVAVADADIPVVPATGLNLNAGRRTRKLDGDGVIVKARCRTTSPQ